MGEEQEYVKYIKRTIYNIHKNAQHIKLLHLGNGLLSIEQWKIRFQRYQKLEATGRWATIGHSCKLIRNPDTYSVRLSTKFYKLCVCSDRNLCLLKYMCAPVGVRLTDYIPLFDNYNNKSSNRSCQHLLIVHSLR